LEAEKLHIQDWQNVSGAERMAAAWDMVEEPWMLKKHAGMNSDFKELLDALNEAEVEYLIVGG